MRAVGLLVLLALSTVQAGPVQPGIDAPGATGQGTENGLARVEPALARDVAGLAPGATVPTLLVHERGQTGIVVQGLEARGMAHATLAKVGVSKVPVDAALLDRLVRMEGVAAIYGEAVLELHLQESRPLIGADVAHDELGVDGTGVTVLVIDTGVDGLHPDLMDRIVEVAQPNDPLERGGIPPGYQTVLMANDWFGHGTHVSGIVAGTGQGVGPFDPNHGRYIGIAPGAELAVWSIPGLGNGETVFQALQGFEYALENQERLGLRAITNSWGIVDDFDPSHPINVASLEAYKAGMVVLFSTANAGRPSDDSDVRTNMFSTAPWVVGVAAANKDGTLASFSSQGRDPAVTGDFWDVPTITAPGASIMAAKSRMGAMQALGPGSVDGPIQDSDLVGQATHYQFASGTSMSCPMVAGVVALMLSAHPTLSPDQVMDVLVRTATPMDGQYWEVGAGMVNASAAIAEARALTGMLDDFLAGHQAYADPDVPLNDPLLAHVLAPAPLAPVGDPDEAEPAATPAWGITAFMAALGVAIVVARRR